MTLEGEVNWGKCDVVLSKTGFLWRDEVIDIKYVAGCVVVAMRCVVETTISALSQCAMVSHRDDMLLETHKGPGI